MGRTKIDWSIPRLCSRCEREMRPRNFVPDGRPLAQNISTCSTCAGNHTARSSNNPGRTQYTSTEQKCSWCSRWLLFSNFYKGKSPVGLQTRCKLCCTLAKHRLPYTEYLKIIDAQGHKCGICKVELNSGKNLEKACIDHNHNCCTGRASCGTCIRGIICNGCNYALGHFRDNLESIHKASVYIRRDSISIPNVAQVLSIKSAVMATNFKVCSGCVTEKPISEYILYKGKTVDNLCKVCRYLKGGHNISLSQYNYLLDNYGLSCNICADRTSKLLIDHNHKCCPVGGRSCGKCIRGLLCSSCNSGLGYVKESSQTLKSMITYLTVLD